jgi:hypothetical protein
MTKLLNSAVVRRVRGPIVLALAVAGSVVAALQVGQGDEKDSATQESLRYDAEYPAIGYSTARPSEAIAQLQAGIERGAIELRFEQGRGYLDSLLAALDIHPSSQVLVFSRTSLQSRRIRPETPRAIYFNDDVYVAWVQQGPIEIGSLDSNLGPVFYMLEQSASEPRFERELTRCLSCHDSYSLTGGGVPRFIVGSGYTGAGGDLITHEGWILVTDRTPLKSRWGGWYVTGRHGDQEHLGNMVIRAYADFERLEELRVGNIETLDHLFDTSPYVTNTSDIVALMIFEHQVNVQNLITRVSYDTRSALHRAQDADTRAGEIQELIEDAVEPLVQAMLFVDEIALTSPIAGDPSFVEQFTGRAVRDERGRSLRELDFTRRMFRYPLSYLVYSAAFAALPEPAKQAVYRRFASVLSNEDRSEAFAHLSAADRAAVLEILAATKPDFVAALGD